MEKEWFKWKKGADAEEHVDYDETWYEGDWVQDWSQPSEAWDRYATLDCAVSKHTLKNQSKKPSETPVEKRIRKKQPGKRSEPAAKDTATAVSKHDTEQDKHPKKKKVEGDDDCECTTPEDTKGQVNSIAKYLRVIKGAGWKVKGHGDLTDDIKREFKKDFPTTEECRYNIYWKLASVGVHLKSEKEGFGYLLSACWCWAISSSASLVFEGSKFVCHSKWISMMRCPRISAWKCMTYSTHASKHTWVKECYIFLFKDSVPRCLSLSLSLWGELCRSQIPPATWEGGLLEWGLGHSDSEGFPEVFSFESFEACLQMISMSQQIPTLPNMWQWAFLSKLLWVVTSFMLKLGNGVKQTHLPKSGQAWTCRAFTWTPHRSSDQHVYTHITPNSKD